MKKICIVTATRADYGYLKWLMQEIKDDSALELQVVVTGAHLITNQGFTVDQIIADGAPIAEKVYVEIDNSSPEGICYTMAQYAKNITSSFVRLKPDILVVLGDRYELLPICSTAFMMGIPIAHLVGGDITEGALDDGVRNAITMLATYHFPTNADSAKNIIRMRGSDKNVYTVGSTSLDSFNRMSLMTRNQLSKNLNLDERLKWALCTFHPETKESLEYNLDAVHNMISALKKIDGYQVVITKSNLDYGGIEINDYLQHVAKNNPVKYKLIPSLGQLRYMSFMKQVELIIGNSSSGILESPFLGTPTINIGNRQKGRHQCNNVIQCGISEKDISLAIEKCVSVKNIIPDNYYGNGFASKMITEVLKEL